MHHNIPHPTQIQSWPQKPLKGSWKLFQNPLFAFQYIAFANRSVLGISGISLKADRFASILNAIEDFETAYRLIQLCDKVNSCTIQPQLL